VVIRIPRTSLAPEPQGPSVAPRSTIATGAPVTNPAAELARPASQAAALAARIYQDERDREIQTRVVELDIERRRSDADVLAGYFDAQGKDAVERRGQVMQALQANSKRVREGIQDRTVAEVWRLQDQQLTDSAMQQIDGHYRRERTRWQVDTQAARAELLVSDLGRVAFGEGFDPATGRLSVEAERTRSAFHDTIGELGALQGWSSERIEAERRKADSAAFGQVAESLLRGGSFEAAQRVLEAHGDKIDVGLRDRLLQSAREGIEQRTAAQATAQRAQKAQSLALKFADEAAGRGGSIDEQKARALSTAEWTFRGKRITADEYDSIVQRLDRHFRIRDEQDAAASKQTIVEAERFLQENPLSTLEDRPELFERVKKQGHLRSLLEFQRSGRYSTDPEVWARFRGRSDQELRAMPADRLWVQLRPRLSNADLDDAMARHARANNAANSDQLHIISVNDRVELAARQMGILPKSPGDKPSPRQQQDFEEWRARVDRDLQTWQERHGKKATPEDVQRMLDVQVEDVVKQMVPGMLYGANTETVHMSRLPNRSVNTFVQVGGRQVWLSQITDEEWEKTSAQLTKDGVLPTARNIVDKLLQIQEAQQRSAASAAPTPSAPASAAADEIPPRVRDRVVGDLTRLGIAPTQDRIMGYWVAQGRPRN
jgi:hypothetical protein